MDFFGLLCWAFIILPIPLGFLWVFAYRYRKDVGLPDWLSGLLADGIISGHAIQSGNAKEEDYGFIIIAITSLENPGFILPEKACAVAVAAAIPVPEATYSCSPAK